eukprot:SAG31_NODE_402_length_16197_cov_5.262425_5_plen_69_part_00
MNMYRLYLKVQLYMYLLSRYLSSLYEGLPYGHVRILSTYPGAAYEYLLLKIVPVPRYLNLAKFRYPGT